MIFQFAFCSFQFAFCNYPPKYVPNLVLEEFPVLPSPRIIPVRRGVGWPRTAYLCLVGFGAWLLVGCGGKGAAPLTEHEQIAEMVSSYVQDVKDNPTYLAARFAKGAIPKPAELKRFAQYSYQPAAKAAAAGDHAKMKVRVLDLNEKEVGVVEWTLVKEGNEWKLQTAPLP